MSLAKRQRVGAGPILIFNMAAAKRQGAVLLATPLMRLPFLPIHAGSDFKVQEHVHMLMHKHVRWLEL